MGEMRGEMGVREAVWRVVWLHEQPMEKLYCVCIKNDWHVFHFTVLDDGHVTLYCPVYSNCPFCRLKNSA